MKLELLKQLYALYTKYQKLNWTVKFPHTLLGHKITLVYTIDNYYDAYSTPDVSWEQTIIPKASQKFFNELESALNIDIDDCEFVGDTAYDVEKELADELKPFTELRLPTDKRRAIHNFFYNRDGKLKTWKEIEKTYTEDSLVDKVTTIRLSSDYSAVIKKDKPVEVGCQRIPIDIVRKIVEAYDKL